MISFMMILKIYQEEQRLVKNYVIKHLTLLKIQDMMDTKELLLHCCINFLIKSPITLVNKFAIADASTTNSFGGAIKIKLCQTNN